jgi:hypothetical protein
MKTPQIDAMPGTAPLGLSEYEVVVGTVGTVITTTSRIEGLREFYKWSQLSDQGYDKTAHEPVTLMRDGIAHRWTGRAV